MKAGQEVLWEFTPGSFCRARCLGFAKGQVMIQELRNMEVHWVDCNELSK